MEIAEEDKARQSPMVWAAHLPLYKIKHVRLKPFQTPLLGDRARGFGSAGSRPLEALNKRHFLGAFGPMINFKRLHAYKSVQVAAGSLRAPASSSI
jgi:hypothetical protein